MEATKQAADPRWKERRFQLYHESREDYIRGLVQNIADCKAMIQRWDEVGGLHPGISEELSQTIEVERECLNEYQDELRKVMQDGQS